MLVSEDQMTPMNTLMTEWFHLLIRKSLSGRHRLC